MDKKILMLSLLAAGNVFGMDEGSFSPYRASPVFFNQQQMRSASPTGMSIDYDLSQQQKRTPSMRNLGHKDEVYDMVYELAAKAYTGQFFCYEMVLTLVRDIFTLNDPDDWTKGYDPSVIRRAKCDVELNEEKNDHSDSNMLRFSWFLDDAVKMQIRHR